MNQVIWSALAMAAWIAGLFFLRFWRTSRDRLFVFFFVAFWVFAGNWLLLATTQFQSESRHYGYVPRLIAYAILIAGIIDKNRRAQ